MSKQRIKDNEQIIIQLREEGKSRQEIADALGFTKAQMKNWVSRYNRRQEKQAAGIPVLPKGRPRKNFELTEGNRVEYYKHQLRLAKSENKRLKMENELMRDYLSRSQERSEGQRQVQRNLPPQGEVQHQRDVPYFRRFTQRLLRVCKADGTAGKGSAVG